MTAAEPAAPVTTDRPAVDADDTAGANRLFSQSILISAIRCTLAYVVFPWLLPALGVAKGLGPAIGLTVGVVAIGFNVYSIRRFHASDHRWKWYITALNVTVIILLTVLAIQDLGELF